MQSYAIMDKIDNQVPQQKEKPVGFWIGMFLVYMIMAVFSAGIISNFLLVYIFNGSYETVTEFITKPNNFEGMQTTFVSIQALSSMIAFILGTYFFLRRENGKLYKQLTSDTNSIHHQGLIMVGILTFFAFPTFSLIGDLNQEALKLIVSEETLSQLAEIDKTNTNIYKYLLSVEELPVLVLSIIGLAIIPGVGEELVFRGVLQSLFKRAFDNKHIAIWASAFIFSAIHLEWSNFILRLIIGGLFGYLYEHTKNIYTPIIAHAAYNSTSLIIAYLITNGVINTTLESSIFADNTWIFFTCYSMVPIGLFIAFFKKTKSNVV